VRTYEIGRDVQWVNGKLELEFEGNRVDAIAGWADPYYGGDADVRIDGQRPSERPELYRITRVQRYVQRGLARDQPDRSREAACWWKTGRCASWK
jgi:hypothetical protein